jgi:acyl transferase domain-containing protein
MGAPSVAFVYPGFGDHYRAWSPTSTRTSPFADAFDRCAETMTAEIGLDIRSALNLSGTHRGPAGSDPLDLRALMGVSEVEGVLADTRVAQLVTFAVEAALTAVLDHCGPRRPP